MTGRVEHSLAAVGLLGALALAASAQTVPAPVGRTTFYKDVLPILQNNCQSCHRPGEVAPLSLMTYDDARRWAVSIKAAVLSRKMPPWYADPRYGHFSNERRLTPQEIKTLVSWVEGGANPGDPRDAPPPVKFVDGWNIGVPDRVIEMPTAFDVPAEGVVEYLYTVAPGGFTEDTWVQAAELRPGDRSLLHHAVIFIRPPNSTWLEGLKAGEFTTDAKHDTVRERNARRHGGELLIFYTPGRQALQLTDEAKLVKAGSDIVFQLHYTARGTAGADKSKLGLVFATQPPKRNHVVLATSNGSFRIPPYAENYEVKSQVQLQETVTLSSLAPHMHLRGKDFLYRVIYPDGRTETLLSVPRYDFNWQLEYRLAEPLVLPKGTRIECTAHFDNSVNNPYNPDPSKEVRWGDQNWDEMMTGFITVSVDPSIDTAGLIKHEQPGTRTPVVETQGEQAAKPADATGRPRGSRPRK